MRILGVDPGLRTIGLGLVETSSKGELRALDWLTIETRPQTSPAERLAEIARDLETYLEEKRPDRAVVEKLFFATNEQTAIEVAQGRGALLSSLGKAGIPVLEPTPMQLKATITGDGRADKAQIQAMLVRMLKLESRPTPDDAADALALAVYGTIVGETVMLARENSNFRI